MQQIPDIPLRIGLIGLGGIARSSHIPALLQLRAEGWPVVVGAIAERDATNTSIAVRSLRQGDCLGDDYREYSDGSALLTDRGIDCALILTPPSVTPELIRIAIESGIPVLAEKPVAHEPVAIAALIEVERQYPSSFVRIAYNRRSQPLAAAFRLSLGEIRKSNGLAPVHLEARLWRSARMDSIFYEDTMIHALDFVLWSMGPMTVERVEWWHANSPGRLPAGMRVSLSSLRASAQATTAAIDVRPSVGRDLESYEVLASRQTLELNYSVGDPQRNPAQLSSYKTGQLSLVVDAEADSVPSSIVFQGFVLQLAKFLTQVASSAEARSESSLSTLRDAHAALALRDNILALRPVSV